MNKKRLKEICKETELYIKDVISKMPTETTKSIKETVFFNSWSEVANLNKLNNKYMEHRECIVDVLNSDTIECAMKMKNNKYNPLVLNMASSFTPGGGWRNGSMAQEEELFRRTTYMLSLEQPEILKKYRLPLLAGIYSPSVVVFRGTKPEEYYVYEWKDCTTLDFIAVPAIKNPTLEKKDEEYRLLDKDANIIENKIKLIFETAILYGNDSLVLGALGNGAYNNPPKHTAEIFRKVIGEYKKYFKYIAFAIISDKNDKYGNYNIYKNIFSL